MEAGAEAAFSDEITRTFADVPLQEDAGARGWAGLAVEGLSLLGALAIMIPVAWTYIIIKRSGGYDQSVVHTLIILPVAVTGIVIIVKTSVALAFSLAGIVAAVRFRTTLEDTKDAVYVFLAIGVGLAAGSQRLGTALLASMVFNAVNLFLWKIKFGNIYVDQLHRTSSLGLGDVLAGAGICRGGALDRRRGTPHGDASIGHWRDGGSGGPSRALPGRGDGCSAGEEALRPPTRLYESRRRGTDSGGGPAQRNDRAVAFGRDHPGAGRCFGPPVPGPAQAERAARRHVGQDSQRGWRPRSSRRVTVTQESNQAEETGMRNAHLPLLCCVTALVSIAPATAAGQASAASAPQIPAMFSSHELIEFTIEADYGALRGDRTEDSEYREAILRLTDDEGVAREIDIRVRTRGIFRLENCRFPPLRVNVPRSRVGRTVFDGQNGIKLVSHCRDRDDDEQDLLKEYLVYRTFNLLTDESFRVRLAHVTYADGPDDDDPVVRYVFFIEEAEAMAERLGATYLEIAQASPRNFGAEEAARVSIFQYMVGNTDWSMVRFHNAEVLQTSRSVYVPVPYDFDWTGFVSAPYARPDERLGIRNVRQRIYRGFCRPNFDFSRVYGQFKEIRSDLEALYTSQEGLDEGDARDVVEYIDGFYEDIETMERADDRLMDDCRDM